jgi:hypothetical protein
MISALSLSLKSSTSTRRLFSTNPLPYCFQRALIPPSGIPHEAKSHLPLTKIVATIGPASEQLPMLSKVFDAGLNVMRINFSHATYDEADLRTQNLNACRENDASSVKPKDNWLVNTAAIMLDTQGPEIRTGSFEGGVKEVDLVAGNEVRNPVFNFFLLFSSTFPLFTRFSPHRLLLQQIRSLKRNKTLRKSGFLMNNLIKLLLPVLFFCLMMVLFNFKLWNSWEMI